MNDRRPTWWSKLRCLKCGERLAEDDARLSCQRCGCKYPLSHSRPVLIGDDSDLFSVRAYLDSATPATRKKRFPFSTSINLARSTALAWIKDLLGPSDSLVLVIGCGNQRREIELIFKGTSTTFVFCDVDPRADADLFCDAHRLPFVDASFDGTIATAVLEHVADPRLAVDEIRRTLKEGGVLYSEIPFLQGVHEGAYDFTRFTLSGHRRLFREFQEENSGMVAGPGTSLVWAIEGFFLAFGMSGEFRQIVKALVRLCFGWLALFDYPLKHRAAAMDSASCTYFLGRKGGKIATDRDIVRRYIGGIRSRHIP